MLLFLDFADDGFFYAEIFIFLLKNEEFVGEVRNIYRTGKTLPDILTFS